MSGRRLCSVYCRVKPWLTSYLAPTIPPLSIQCQNVRSTSCPVPSGQFPSFLAFPCDLSPLPGPPEIHCWRGRHRGGPWWWWWWWWRPAGRAPGYTAPTAPLRPGQWEMAQIEHLEENLEIMTIPLGPRGLHSSSLIFASQHKSCFPFIGQKLALSSIIGKL